MCPIGLQINAGTWLLRPHHYQHQFNRWSFCACFGCINDNVYPRTKHAITTTNSLRWTIRMFVWQASLQVSQKSACSNVKSNILIKWVSNKIFAFRKIWKTIFLFSVEYFASIYPSSFFEPHSSLIFHTQKTHLLGNLNEKSFATWATPSNMNEVARLYTVKVSWIEGRKYLFVILRQLKWAEKGIWTRNFAIQIINKWIKCEITCKWRVLSLIYMCQLLFNQLCDFSDENLEKILKINLIKLSSFVNECD